MWKERKEEREEKKGREEREGKKIIRRFKKKIYGKFKKNKIVLREIMI